MEQGSLETRPSPSSTRACTSENTPTRNITYGACARGGGRRPGFEARAGLMRATPAPRGGVPADYIALPRPLAVEKKRKRPGYEATG